MPEKAPEEATWKRFFEDVAAPLKKTWVKAPGQFYAQASEASQTPPFPVLYNLRKVFADLFCTGNPAIIKGFCFGRKEKIIEDGQLVEDDKSAANKIIQNYEDAGGFKKIFSPLKCLNLFKIPLLISRSLEVLAIGIGSLFNTTKKDSKLHMVGRAIKRVFLFPFSATSVLLGPLAQIDKSPLGIKVSSFFKRIFSKKEKKIAGKTTASSRSLTVDNDDRILEENSNEENLEESHDSRNESVHSPLLSHESADSHQSESEHNHRRPIPAANDHAFDEALDSESAPLISKPKHKVSFFSRVRSLFSSTKKEFTDSNLSDDTYENQPTVTSTPTSAFSSVFNFFRSTKKPNTTFVLAPAYEGTSYEEAVAIKNDLLKSQPQSAREPAALFQRAAPALNPNQPRNITPIRVIPITIHKHQRHLIETVTIQRHDTNKQSAKSEFYFQKNDLKKLTGMAAMEWAARNIESFLEIMPDKNQPIKIIAGNMTPACIEALIVYCKYKNLQYIPPREFKKSISDAKVDAFEKKWLAISEHSNDERAKPSTVF